MKIPLNWLRDYVSLKIDSSTLVDRLTIAGLEVANVRFFGEPVPVGMKAKVVEPGPEWERGQLFVGQIRKIEGHPQADKLKIVEVDYGAPEPKRVITGAPNIAIGESGQKVILGLKGTQYWLADKKDPTKGKVIATLEPKELRGILNDSMLFSTFELGIDEDHEGIILLEADAPIGKPLVDFMGDTVLEVDVLPNMARCLAMIGVAREVAAITGSQATIPPYDPKFAKELITGQVSVEIADPKLCGRYSAMLIRDVTIGPAPGWMQRRLVYAGMRPIFNIVDVTNYVMLEWGQPLHAFDFDVLLMRTGGKPPRITVRPALPGEKLKTLDGVERELSSEHLVIADSAGPIALAGVMGGAETEVTTATRNVLLESANFDPVSIRRTAKAFNLFSEASTRFSRGLHTEVVHPASFRAAKLIQETAGGRVLRGTVDIYPAPTPAQAISLSKKAIRRTLGIDLPHADVERVLKALEFDVQRDGFAGWKVTVPPFRTDIQAGEADIIEDLARIHGYDHLPSTLLSGELPAQLDNPLHGEEAVRDILASAGLQEVRTYSLTSPRYEALLNASISDLKPIAKVGLDKIKSNAINEEQRAALKPIGEYITLKNPINPEREAMRRSVLVSVLEVTRANLNHTDTVRFFEVGFVYIPSSSLPTHLPDEPRRLAIVLTGRRQIPAWDDPLGATPSRFDFFDLKGIIEELAASLHLPAVTFHAAKDVAYLHPGRAAEVRVSGKTIGYFGELHPKTAIAFDFGERTILAADLDVEAMLAAVPARFAYAPLSQYQAALRDIAVVVDEAITNEALLTEIKAGGGELLRDVRLFDLYRGESIAAGKKSLAYALSYQALDRTLTDKEIDKAHKKIEDRLRHMLKASIRGKDA